MCRFSCSIPAKHLAESDGCWSWALFDFNISSLRLCAAVSENETIEKLVNVYRSFCAAGMLLLNAGVGETF
jgi:hypothetical protein